jgi:ferric-dicitrate binding protein FerR (iron transport regulator)
MRLNIPWNLFTKLFRSELSELETLELEEWRDSSELNQNIYDEIIEDANIKEVILAGKWEDNSKEWEELINVITIPKRNITLPRKTFYLTFGIAASIVLLLGISFGLLYDRIIQKDSRMPDGYTFIFSPRGQRTRIILPDQTKVWLNSESSIRYPVNYNQKTREVQIKGEAFFKVHKDPKKPFLVYANEIKVKVYGTSFNIKAFPNEKYIETTLIEGKLSITLQDKSKKAGEEIFLKPNEKCIYKRALESQSQISSNKEVAKESKTAVINEHTSSIVTEPIINLAKNINTDKEVSWKDGELIFRDETFEELAIKLERWYDMKIHFEDNKIKNYKFTGAFDKETINQAIEALKLSSQQSFQYEIKFRDIYLKSK